MSVLLTGFVGACLEKLFELTEMIGFPSYALAIVLITIIIKLILFPLNQKQIKSTKNMQLVQPKIQEINAKYANNPQKKSEEMMKIYQENNINPMAGCLPLLIQLPIIMILYRGLLNFQPAHPEEYFLLGSIPLGSAPEGLIIPIIVGLGTFLQSFTSMGVPKDTTQRMMIIMMPLMIGWMATQFQVFICLYWFTFSILGVIQQLIINRGLTPQSGATRRYGTAGANGAAGATVDVKPVKEPTKGSEKGTKNVNTSKKKKKK